MVPHDDLKILESKRADVRMCGCALSLGNIASSKPLVGPEKNPDSTPTKARNQCAITDARAGIVIFACNSQPADLILTLCLFYLARIALAHRRRAPRASGLKRKPVLVDWSRTAAGKGLRDGPHPDFWYWAPEPLSGYKMCDIIFCAVGVPPPAARLPEETF